MEELKDTDTIDMLEISVRAYNVLRQNGIHYIGDLKNYDLVQIRNFKNCGNKTINEIEDKLDEFGVNLKLNEYHQFYTAFKNFHFSKDFELGNPVHLYSNSNTLRLYLNTYKLNLKKFMEFDFACHSGMGGIYTLYAKRDLVITTLFLTHKEIPIKSLSEYFDITPERVRQITRGTRRRLIGIFRKSSFFMQYPEYSKFDDIGYCNLFDKSKEGNLIVLDSDGRPNRIKNNLDTPQCMSSYIDSLMADLFGKDIIEEIATLIRPKLKDEDDGDNNLVDDLDDLDLLYDEEDLI